ncbi:TetR/AcrR family transcriptional regulator C-terminal domain-containing protein [Streptomonospora sediminis]
MARAALALVNTSGLESLTMRRLATSLGVQLPTIYRLFNGKQALLDEMAEMILSGVLDRAVLDGADWEQCAAVLARAMRETLLEQRDGARIVGGSCAAKNHTLALAETMLVVMRDAGFPAETAMRANTTIACYVIGEVLEQQSADGGAAGVPAAALHGWEPADGADAPVGVFLDFDGRFDFGLRVVLAGLNAVLAEDR